jgi:peptidylprolyl isomerase
MEKLSVVILAEGQGDPIQVGQTAVVHYTGTLIDGVVFDSSLTRGTPLEFRYGVGSVIAGWEKGLENMKVGEKRRLVIPPEFGYGDTQVGSIPAGSTLIFDVELLEIK